MFRILFFVIEEQKIYEFRRMRQHHFRLTGLGGTGRPIVWSNATLDYESSKVDATVCMTVAEQNSNRAMFSGCGVEYVFTSEPDRVIEGMFGDVQSHIHYTHGRQAEAIKEGVRDGPVGEWTFSGFGDNAGADREIQVAAQLNKIRVVSTVTDGCVSAIAYSEARADECAERRDYPKT